ncbi:MAG: nucleoside triphosphate pyrophosphohydrolase, partial [Deltaproteobacteria bacterium]|nr:nucleoside triphosphate pyrophosphohydrolase [Deltaproteobacteria bacterium]
MSFSTPPNDAGSPERISDAPDLSGDQALEKAGEGSSAAPAPPPGPSPDSGYALSRLEAMIDGLLHPLFGCPWDKKQTTKSVTEDFLEEVYELRQALNEDSAADILEEAGDVAFLLVFLGRLTRKTHDFGLESIFDAATDKMLARHPHVFGQDGPIKDMDSFWRKWHKIKREAKPSKGVLDSVPTDLPALTRCHRLAQKASRSGFDFPDSAEVRRVLDSELRELDQEILAGRSEDPEIRERQAHEIGDVLASVVNLARLMGFSAEKCLDTYNRRFVSRFKFMEEALAAKGLRPEEAGAEELEALWAEAKVKLARRQE